MNKDIKLIKKNYTPIQKELVRKTIHMTIAFIPLFINVNRVLTIILLIMGSALYLLSEYYRASGRVGFRFISTISAIASRDRDRGLTLGPVTLAMGTLLVLLTFNPVAATCGIYALAFGDGLSSVTGKLWGTKKIPLTGGKSFVGFFTCFTMILSTTYGVTGSLSKSIFAAIGGSLIELVPIKDVDNLLIPFVVALIVTI
ncbi:MAG: phosphatidate cytidylyltransferase [Spirochaetaceae bacterium]